MNQRLREILAYIPENRQRKLMDSRGCALSEARHIANLLLCLKDHIRPNISNISVQKPGSIIPARATILTKPYNPGENTSIVLSSKTHELEGMLLYQGVPLRVLRSDATYPKNSPSSPSFDHEGRGISESAKKLGFRGFELNEPVMFLLPLILEKMQIAVGPSFYHNIDVFTKYMNGEVD